MQQEEWFSSSVNFKIKGNAIERFGAAGRDWSHASAPLCGFVLYMEWTETNTKWCQLAGRRKAMRIVSGKIFCPVGSERPSMDQRQI